MLKLLKVTIDTLKNKIYLNEFICFGLVCLRLNALYLRGFFQYPSRALPKEYIQDLIAVH